MLKLNRYLQSAASDPIKKVKIKRFSTMRNRFNNVLHRFKNDSDRFRIVDQ